MKTAEKVVCAAKYSTVTPEIKGLAGRSAAKPPNLAFFRPINYNHRVETDIQ